MKLAAIIKTNTHIIIHSISRTSMGVNIASAPFFHIGDDNVNNTIDYLLRALNSSELNVVHPKQNEWAIFRKAYLEGIKFKSIKELHDKSIYCSVKQIDNYLFFMPTVNFVSEKGFEDLPAKEQNISIEEKKDKILITLYKSLSLCERR